MKKFEVRKTYYARSACNSDTIFEIKIVKRTAKSIVYEQHGKVNQRAFFKTDQDGEYFVQGNYSMAPVFRATKEIETEPKKELPDNVIDYAEAKRRREEQKQERVETITKDEALTILGDRARELAANPEVMQEARKMQRKGKTPEEIQTWIYHLAVGTLIGVK